MLLAGFSLEEMTPDGLLPIALFLMKHDYNKAAVMVIDAILVSTPNDMHLIKTRSRLEADFDQPKALQSLLELMKLGVADASDYLLYGRLLWVVEKDQKAAGDALSHAVEICQPSERFDTLVECAHIKGAIGDEEGAVKYFTEADSIGQLDFEALKRLGGMRLTSGDAAAAKESLNRAAAMDPSNATVRQRLGSCKLVTGDVAGAVADLDAAILLGLQSPFTYQSRGVANLQLGQLDAALADLNQAVAESEQQMLHDALRWRAEVKRKMGDHQGAIADESKAKSIEFELPANNRFYLL